jgi:hypothetical protein
VSATMRSPGTKIVRVHYERADSGFYFASSEDIDGLVLSAKTCEELDDLVPGAITDLYAACGMKVIVSWVDQKPEDHTKSWAAFPAELAKQKLKEMAAA